MKSGPAASSRPAGAVRSFPSLPLRDPRTLHAPLARICGLSRPLLRNAGRFPRRRSAGLSQNLDALRDPARDEAREEIPEASRERAASRTLSASFTILVRPYSSSISSIYRRGS